MKAHCHPSRLSRLFLLPGLLVLLILDGGLAHAQPGTGGPIDLQLFRPAVDSKGYITLDGPQTMGHLNLSLNVGINYGYRPFSIQGESTGGVWCRPGVACTLGDESWVPSRYSVNHLVSGNLTLALGLSKYFQIGVGMPISFWSGSTTPVAQTIDDSEEDTTSAFGIGDLMLHLKGRILEQGKFPLGLGLRLTVAFPTGPKESFLSSERFRVTPVLLLERTLLKGRLRLALNIGAHLRFGQDLSWTDSRLCTLPNGDVADCGSGRTLQSRHHLFYGLGVGFTIVKDRLDALVEVVGQTPFDGLFDFSAEGPLGSAHEAIIGFRWRLLGKTYFEFGCGFGLTRGEHNFQWGTPQFRPYFGLVVESELTGAKRFAMKAAEWAPVKAAIERFKKMATDKLEAFLEAAKAKIKELAMTVVNQAVAKALEFVFQDDVQKLIQRVIGAYGKWKEIQAQLVVVYTTAGRQLAEAKARLKGMLEKAQTTAGDLQKILRTLVEERIKESVRPRVENLLNSQWDKVVNPLLEKGGNILTTIAGSIPGAGGVLTASVNFLLAKARTSLKTWTIGKAMGAIDSVVEKSLDKIFEVVFRKGGRLEGALTNLSGRLQKLEKALEEATAAIETKRKALLSAIR